MLSDRIEGSIKNGVGRLQDGAGGLLDDSTLQVKGKMNEAAGFVQDLVGQAKSQFSDVVDSAKDRAAEPLDVVRSLVTETFDRNQDRLDDVKAMVVKNPIAAVGIAAAAGILMGLFLKRTSR